MTSILHAPHTPSAGTADRAAVPWLTVVPLAVAMAYADGFWMTSLRGVAGAIERTQTPFASWLRESTLALPVFVFAVLGVLTVALGRFGAAPRTRSLVATSLLVVAAGTLVGIAELAVSSGYDYHLQVSQLQMMDSMRGTCVGGGCLEQQQHASLLLQVRAVGYGSVLLVLTNLVVVGWVLAMRGGRLDLSKAPRHDRRSSRVDDLRLLLVAGLVGSAAVHAAVVPEHLTEWGAAGVFFVVLVAAELGVAGWLVSGRQPPMLLAAAAVSIGPLVLWAYSRSFGLPFGPGAGVPEPVGLADCVACALEVGTLVAAAVLLRRDVALRRRPPLSVHVSRLAVVAVVAVTAVGVAGTGLARYDAFGAGGDHSAASNPH